MQLRVLAFSLKFSSLNNNNKEMILRKCKVRRKQYKGKDDNKTWKVFYLEIFSNGITFSIYIFFKESLIKSVAHQLLDSYKIIFYFLINFLKKKSIFCFLFQISNAFFFT